MQDWVDTALYARTLIQDGEQLSAFYSAETEAQPEVTDKMLLNLEPESYDALARALAETLDAWGLSAETICTAALGGRLYPRTDRGL